MKVEREIVPIGMLSGGIIIFIGNARVFQKPSSS
jgi:hypothetical protein